MKKKMQNTKGSAGVMVIVYVAIVTIFSIFGGNNREAKTPKYTPSKETKKVEYIETIVSEPVKTQKIDETVYYLGILPLESVANMTNQFEPTAKHIRDTTGLNVVLKTYEPKPGAESFTDVVRDISSGKIHFAYLAGATTIQANANGPVVPFACAQQKGSPIYYGHLAVKIDSPYQSIEDLKDKKVCGSSMSSVSGNFMPSSMMKKVGIDPTTYFEGGMQFPGSHDKAAQAVLDGQFEGCFINEQAFNKFNKNEKVLRSIWRHDAVPEFPFCVNLDKVPSQVFEKVKSAILTMHETNLIGVQAANPKYEKWVSIGLEDFASMKVAIDDLYGQIFYDLENWGKEEKNKL